jgi:sugar lactone lactonase YvrE
MYVNADDGRACTRSATTATGVCRSGDCAECLDSSQCHDGNPCTTDLCESTTSTCTHAAQANGASCTQASGSAGICESGRCASCTLTDGHQFFPPPPTSPSGSLTVVASGINGVGLFVAQDGLVYVTAPSGGRIHKIDPSTSPPSVQVFASGFTDPLFLVLDPSSSNLWVAERTANRVSRIPITAGTAGPPQTAASGFDGPLGLIFDVQGNLLISNELGATIDRLSASGAISRGVITSLRGPADLKRDLRGNLYVSEYAGNPSTNNMLGTGLFVRQFDAALNAVRTYQGGYSGAVGIAIDRDANLYVSSFDGNTAGGGTIIKTSQDGTTSTTFISGLTGPEQIAFDAAGSLYIAEFGTGRVLRLEGTSKLCP